MLDHKAEGCSGCGGCSHHTAPMPSLPVPLRPSPTPLSHVTGGEVCFHNAHLLVAASCGPFACEDFHRRFIRKRVTLIACPGDSGADHTATLSAILTRNTILTLTVVRMEGACCDGLEAAAREALRSCDKFIPWQVVTLGADGKIME